MSMTSSSTRLDPRPLFHSGAGQLKKRGSSRRPRARSSNGSSGWAAARILRIGHATRCELVDRAEIGSADFYGIEFDAHAGVVTIEGSIPVTISIDVRRLDVGAEETDEVIGLARYTTWSSGADSYTGNVLPLR
jgi:hypothetical protein